ncbi:spore germination protein GerPC [Peribacillus kribbensis]|uniref:spore germination protein GerPC n=1 Tax=Peribacillus kribbensis TaxID=356658 RepID=UPI0003F56DFA|nr:spore germination protein GerPC [Peribacillus kribbensis]
MNDIYTYLNQLQAYLQQQETRIRNLEASLQNVNNQLQQLKDKPPVNVERIEYRFDQLKVERLDGTLNIGLNPNELQNIDEFAVNSAGPPPPFLFPEREQAVQNICRVIQDYINTELTENLSRASKGSPIDPSYLNFIKDDIIGQLPQKIQQYLDSTPPVERTPEQLPQILETIIEKLKIDVSQALFTFVNQLSNQ